MFTLTHFAQPKRARREQRAERRRLKRLDALSSQLAELHAIDAVLVRAGDVVSQGWVQNAWFSVPSQHGVQAVAGPDLDLTRERPVTGACLVGSVIEGGGGVEAVESQLVQRSLDLVWHTLREDAERPVRWCPGPGVRMIHVLELTYWNDAPGRTRHDVLRLLQAARETAAVERARRRAERDALDPARDSLRTSSCVTGSSSGS